MSYKSVLKSGLESSYGKLLDRNSNIGVLSMGVLTHTSAKLTLWSNEQIDKVISVFYKEVRFIQIRYGMIRLSVEEGRWMLTNDEAVAEKFDVHDLGSNPKKRYLKIKKLF